MSENKTFSYVREITNDPFMQGEGRRCILVKSPDGQFYGMSCVTNAPPVRDGDDKITETLIVRVADETATEPDLRDCECVVGIGDPVEAMKNWGFELVGVP